VFVYFAKYAQPRELKGHATVKFEKLDSMSLNLAIIFEMQLHGRFTE